MSELKAYIAPTADGSGLADYYLKYEADKVIAESTRGGRQMSELKVYTQDEILDSSIGDDVYLQPDVDKILAEKDKKIAELNEERRWRKFPDEKPELGDFVLVKLSERVKGHYFPMDVVRWDSSYELGEIEVSHWMPLPKVPEEADK